MCKINILVELNNKNTKIYLIDALRTPIGKLNGILSHQRPDDMVASVMTAILEQNQLSKEQVDQVLLGCANQAGEDNRNIARMASILAGLPFSTTAITLNTLCSSGLEAIISGARTILTGENDLVIAGGVESMSRSPLVQRKTSTEQVDSMIGWRFVNSAINNYCPPLSMPQTAEIVAKEYGISKKYQDYYAYESRQRYENAIHEGLWQSEIIPTTDLKAKIWDRDEQHRLLSLDLLSKLPKLVPNGAYITAGNSARVGDGAAVLLLASEKFIKENQIQPVAVVQQWAVAACDPTSMSLGAGIATEKLIKKAAVDIDAIDSFEISESFALQPLLFLQKFGVAPSKVNRNGGSISMGNPIGMGAARLVVSLVHQFKKNTALKSGIAATGAGLGLGSAILLESCYE